MLFMKVFYGIKKPLEDTIDFDCFGTRHETSASEKDCQRAYDMLNQLMLNDDFANDGNRNYCAVNACIALHVLGYDAREWFSNWCHEQRQEHEQWYPSDLDKFMGHVERVYPYLKDWGPEGHEELALGFALD